MGILKDNKTVVKQSLEKCNPTNTIKAPPEPKPRGEVLQESVVRIMPEVMG